MSYLHNYTDAQFSLPSRQDDLDDAWDAEAADLEHEAAVVQHLQQCPHGWMANVAHAACDDCIAANPIDEQAEAVHQLAYDAIRRSPRWASLTNEQWDDEADVLAIEIAGVIDNYFREREGEARSKYHGA